mmetsp:Transcript_17154/g.35808  ORF Transcript_17154/g.35808 Transcript_17154/m.35808 type:complete len:754 (+) Transcript_17154:280-2541(+)|eukprot:CAMPEP_0171332632 /NCGR_PEP_ID=MMETSP0878-20121228/3492_1 /TAXON_ID=67004 /ORGANISM="Thalassiosira weissflogii, Strain CCMP1336" /LENGTH=753 /DNA_ID=CAMNT_0011833417 /DNA_START=51 /DNA_END=2312 /DNA_ORIENTATION=+
MASNAHPAASSSSPRTPKEVDYYLNPTELFRWINYRRWDGARARAQSHPDECDTWIVSRHTNDGRILWRHLPLHLVCMQLEAATVVSDSDDPNTAQSARQIESLIDVLLDSYPEAASSPDDQGMLPLHLLLTKAESEPNERVINLLLTSFPNAVDVQDKFGRTPYDILREQCKDGTSERCRAAFRALKRARYVSDKISATIRDESANIVAAVQHEASNERGASQKIIVRLEEEISNTRKQLEERERRDNETQMDMRRLKEQMSQLQSKLDSANTNLEVTRKERDELLAQNDSIKDRLDHHNEEIEKVRREAEDNRQNDLETIANLKSEVSTSKAMTEALESQLRSRFTNEEYLSTSVNDLEEQLEELKVRHEHATKKAQHEVESLNADNKRLKWNNEELSKKNSALQTKLNDLSKQMASIISSHSALSAEHDRLIELSERHESDLLEAIRTERSQLVDSFEKKRQAMEKALAEQEQIIQESLKAEEKIVQAAKQDRARGKSTVEKLRKEFQDIRTAAADRERQMHAEALASSRKMKGQAGTMSANNSTAGTRASGHSVTMSPDYRNPAHTHRPTSGGSRISKRASSSGSADGHLVRMLDERAAQSGAVGGRREPQYEEASSADSSAGQPPYYITHQHVKSSPSPVGRDARGIMLPESLSGSASYHRPPPSGNGGMRRRYYDDPSDRSKDYSLDEYSHTSDTTNGYSEASSDANDGPPRGPAGYHRGHMYPGGKNRSNQQYMSESYGDDSSAME